MSDVLTQLSESLIRGDLVRVPQCTREAIDTGHSADTVLQHGLLAGMDVVGQRFKVNEMFIPEVMRCAKCMHKAMDILRPLLAASDTRAKEKLLIATVEGDLHDIGKNLVIMMYEGAGFEVVDMGIDQKAPAIVAAVQKHQPQLLGLSALLTTTMPKLQVVIDALRDAGIRDSVKVLVGGAPVTKAYADKIGADGYAGDAASAVDAGRELLQK